MTELEWLKQQSGLTDEELNAMQAVAGAAKFTGMLKRMIGENSAALQAKTEAEAQRLDFENRYQNEFIPEMRRVTQDSIRLQGEAAAAKASLEKAREYGIVPDPEPAVAAVAAVRAPGSPDPNSMNREEFARFSNAQSNTIIALNDLNAEHFRMFGSPLPNTQELVDEVNRQRTLGNKNYSLKSAWETKHNVAAKREELSAAAQKKHDDEIIAAALKGEREKSGSNPHTRSGVPSRFSSYKPSEAAGNKQPWQSDHSSRTRNAPWRQNAESKLREASA